MPNNSPGLFDRRPAKLDLRMVPGFGPTLVRRAQTHFGADLDDVLRSDPYKLTAIESIGFLKADAAALHFGMRRADPLRQAAAAVYVLRQAETEGHSAMPMETFAAKVQECIGEPLTGCELGDDVVEDGGLLSRRSTYEKEKNAATILGRMLVLPVDTNSNDGRIFSELAADQVAALRVICRSRVFCLLGSPGTGKTFTLRKVIESNPGARIALCAPTGKAAKRIEQLTGRPAKTIHRLLEAKYDEAKKRFRFYRDATRPLDADFVIIDEASMVDIRLFADLLTALTSTTRLLLVGDSHQLPSVGPGRVLSDLVTSGEVPNVELTSLKRQDPNLLIARNCARIRDGLTPEVQNQNPDGDFYFVVARGEMAIANAVVDLHTKRLPAKYDFDPNRDIVTLTALRDKGPLSAKELNVRLRAVLNPQADGDFAAGDRVIQVANNYRLDDGSGCMNGEIGTMLGREDRDLVVRFDDPDRTIRENRSQDEYFNLNFSWALTVHRAQGAESECAIVVLDPSGRGSFVQSRNHLYTAISRAKRLCVVVGDQETMAAVVGRVKEAGRCTRLSGLLKGSPY